MARHPKPIDLSFEERMKLLKKVAWSYQDVMNWLGVCDRKALEITKAVKEKYGTAPYFANFIKADDFLKEYNTSRKAEMELLIEAARYEKEFTN